MCNQATFGVLFALNLSVHAKRLVPAGATGPQSQKRRLSRKSSAASNVSSACPVPATSKNQQKPVATEQPNTKHDQVVRSATPQRAATLPDVANSQPVLVSSQESLAQPQPAIPTQETQQEWTDAQPRTPPGATPVPSPAPKKKKVDDEARVDVMSPFYWPGHFVGPERTELTMGQLTPPLSLWISAS